MMGKYPVVYKLSGVGDEVYHECGLTFADSYADAMKKLEDYYGDEIIIVECLFLMEESPVVTISEETMQGFIKGDYEGYHIKEEDYNG